MSLQVLSRLVGPVSVGALKYGLALFAMYALLLALTGLYLRQANAAGKLGLGGYPDRIPRHAAHRRRLRVSRRPEQSSPW
jgi:hypothetical protein